MVAGSCVHTPRNLTDEAILIQTVEGSCSFAEVFKSMEVMGYKLQQVSSNEWLKRLESDIRESGSAQPLITVQHLLEGKEPSLKCFGKDDMACASPGLLKFCYR